MPPGIDPLTISFLVIAVVLIFFMFRNSRKVKAQQEELKAKIVPGAEIMTNFGLFGTLISVDEVTKVAEIEVAPGSIVKVHSQTLAKVVAAVDGEVSDEPRSVEEAMERANREYEESQKASAAGESEIGARVESEIGERIESDELADSSARSDADDRSDAGKKPAARSTSEKDSE